MISFLFFCFAGVIIASSIAVVMLPNPVYSVLNLILTFFVSGALFILLGAEVVAMLLVIVYVGAVAVLFLFVVMTLDSGSVRPKQSLVRHYPIGVLCGVTLFSCFAYSALQGRKAATLGSLESAAENVFLIGSQLYTKYFYLFQMSGVLLLAAAVGTLVLTVRRTLTKSGALKQNVKEQLKRSSRVRLLSPEVGAGIGDDG